ncbi:hypothetical protein PMAYCL1PPCAC_21817, partial [Pristionchus mayeri]
LQMVADSILAVNGARAQGCAVRTQNTTAVLALSNILRSSLGPLGQDKMLVDDTGDVIVTNDGATIIQNLQVVHPAATVIAELAKLQDEECGDGTTSVILLAADLLSRAEQLAQSKIHPSTIVAGYRLAAKEATKYLKECLSIEASEIGESALHNPAKTSMGSKIIGPYSDIFSSLVVEATKLVKVVDAATGKTTFPIKAINVLKAHGKSASESFLVQGYALNCTVAAQGMPLSIKDAKIAIIDFSLQKAKMHLGISVVVMDPAKLEAIRREEMNIVKNRVKKILAAGANVILTSGGIDDLCLKMLTEAGVMGVRRCKKADLKRIAKATGATMLSSLANLEGEENFDASQLGCADEVVQQRMSDDELILIRGTKGRTAASIVLRGANEMMLDEMERSVHDSLCVVSRVLESGRLVAGGGAVEAALNVYLESFANTLSSREQLAVAEFAQALLVIPKTLAANAARDSTDLVAKLRAFHNKALQNPELSHLKWAGLDLEKGEVRDNKEAGILEPAMSKVKAIKFATEAAITILRIDDLIKLEKVEQGGRAGQCG